MAAGLGVCTGSSDGSWKSNSRSVSGSDCCRSSSSAGSPDASCNQTHNMLSKGGLAGLGAWTGSSDGSWKSSSHSMSGSDCCRTSCSAVSSDASCNQMHSVLSAQGSLQQLVADVVCVQLWLLGCFTWGMRSSEHPDIVIHQVLGARVEKHSVR